MSRTRTQSSKTLSPPERRKFTRSASKATAILRAASKIRSASSGGSPRASKKQREHEGERRDESDDHYCDDHLATARFLSTGHGPLRIAGALRGRPVTAGRSAGRRTAAV